MPDQKSYLYIIQYTSINITSDQVWIQPKYLAMQKSLKLERGVAPRTFLK